MPVVTVRDSAWVGVDVCADGGGCSAAIRTVRLALVPMSSQVVRAVLQKEWTVARHLLGTPFPLEWRDDGWQWLEWQATRGESDERFIVWGTRLAFPVTVDVGADSGPVVAEVGFHGPPDSEGWVEIGYRVVAEYRRRGLAEEATAALLAWAVAHGVTGVRASVSPDNAASIGLLGKLGFTAAGSHRHPILGEQLGFRRITGAPS